MNTCKTCRECKFASLVGFYVDGLGVKRLICRRNPPSPNWPKIDVDDWCGEWAEKERDDD